MIYLVFIGLIDSDIKWELNEIQGIEFDNEFHLARDLHSKIAYHKSNNKDKSRFIGSNSNNSQKIHRKSGNKSPYKESKFQGERIPFL